MAMFPNATKGYMPFVQGKGTPSTNGKGNKRSRHHVNGGKLHKTSENRQPASNISTELKLVPSKMYQVTLKGKNGQRYTCIIKADSVPDLVEKSRQITLSKQTHSMPNIGSAAANTGSSPSKARKILAEKTDALTMLNREQEINGCMDLRECGKKEGLFSSIVRFFKEKTGKSEKKSKSKSGKSKRKPRDLTQRKRQRTVSAMSNLDPIEECQNEHEFEDDDDNDSYTHSELDSDVTSVASSSISYTTDEDSDDKGEKADEEKKEES